jgi:repressor LexA
MRYRSDTPKGKRHLVKPKKKRRRVAMANYTQRLNEALIKRMADFIKNYQVEKGGSPSQREIADRLDTNQKRVNKYVRILANRGCIELRADGTIAMPRNLDSSNYEFVPMVGSVRCGNPTLAIEEYEGMFRLPREFIGQGEFFMLTADGDSMIGANIFAGDYLVIRKQEQADSGDIVVAAEPRLERQIGVRSMRRELQGAAGLHGQRGSQILPMQQN